MFTIRLTTVFVSSFFLFIVGTLMRMRDLYFMSAALALLPFISYGAARLGMRRLKCNRSLQQYAREEQPVQVSVKLSGRHALLGPVSVDEQLPEWLERTGEQSLSMDAGSGVTTLTYTLLAHKRGVYDLGKLRLHISDPLGFFVFTSHVPAGTELVVTPAPLAVPEMRAASGSVFQDFSSSAFDGRGARGSGLDFHGVREYQSGDELRRVHWASTARHGRLNVVEFEHSTVRDTVIALDLQSGSELGRGRYTTLEYSIRIAAEIAEVALLSGSLVRLAGSGISGLSAVAASGPGQLYAILDTLARVEANRTEALSDVLLREAELIKRGSNLVCFSTSVGDDLIRSLEMLASRGIGVRVILTTLDGKETTAADLAGLMAGRLEFTELHCSADSIGCQVKYDYAI